MVVKNTRSIWTGRMREKWRSKVVASLKSTCKHETPLRSGVDWWRSSYRHISLPEKQSPVIFILPKSRHLKIVSCRSTDLLY